MCLFSSMNYFYWLQYLKYFLGIFLSFLFTFPIVSRPTKASCGIVRFFLGFNYTICYAAILIKTRRIARIFERRGRRLKPKYTSAQSQLMIAAGVMSVEGKGLLALLKGKKNESHCLFQDFNIELIFFYRWILKIF